MINLAKKLPKGKKLRGKAAQALFIRSWGNETELTAGMNCLLVFAFESDGRPKVYEVRKLSSVDFDDVEG